MCLSAEALALFLNLIIATPITAEAGRFIVHGTHADAHWGATGGEWCTMAPQLDRIARFVKDG